MTFGELRESAENGIEGLSAEACQRIIEGVSVLTSNGNQELTENTHVGFGSIFRLMAAIKKKEGIGHEDAAQYVNRL
ncbi:hypothetical protein ACFL0C_00465 [Patescibacteria group bacterium]